MEIMDNLEDAIDYGENLGADFVIALTVIMNRFFSCCLLYLGLINAKLRVLMTKQTIS